MILGINENIILTFYAPGSTHDQMVRSLVRGGSNVCAMEDILAPFKNVPLGGLPITTFPGSCEPMNNVSLAKGYFNGTTSEN